MVRRRLITYGLWDSLILLSLMTLGVITGCKSATIQEMNTGPVIQNTGGNPVISEGSADPSVRVFNDRVYIYSSHDFSKDNDFWIMKNWKVFSSADLVNFTDHGIALKGTDIAWAREPDHCWAPDCAEKNGKYYCICCHNLHQKDFRLFVPARRPQSLADILNAGWRSFLDVGGWPGADNVKDEDRRGLLNELVLKSIEVFEINHILRKTE